MSLFENPENLLLLRNLLNPQDQKDDSDTDEEEPLLPSTSFTPANIGASQPPKANAKAIPLQEKEKVPKTLEEWQELQEKEDAEILETRKCPDYTMKYRQAVGTEDLFLQMGNRTNASASCEDLLLEILMPDEAMSADKMNLSITEFEVDLATSIYRLKLPLVHKVTVDRCSAKYDAELRKLCLTLRLQRELDFVNF